MSYYIKQKLYYSQTPSVIRIRSHCSLNPWLLKTSNW